MSRLESKPWRRISLRMAPTRDGLTWSEALTSPCMTCDAAPCCTHLTLHEFDVEGLTDLDYARYVLNFDRMMLGITHDKKWHVYYRYPCRHLERETSRCDVHGTDAQPHVCQSFSPYACWYKASYSGPVSDTLIQIDRVRLDWILARCRFRDDRSLEAMPSLDEMMAAFPALPAIEDLDADQAALDGSNRDAFDAWRALALGGPAPAATPAKTFTQLADPCAGCAAYCCTSLVFPQKPPLNHAQVDYLRYALGFPGVELGVSPAGWTLTVRTRCRHLEGTRCGAFGQPDRPLICHYYDAHKCGYKYQFGQVRPPSFVRVRAEEFAAVAAEFRFTEAGLSTKIPSPDEVRAAIEASWRAGATITG